MTSVYLLLSVCVVLSIWTKNVMLYEMLNVIYGGGYMRIAVVDGQGGGMGKAIIARLRQLFSEKINILALGTNALATAAMLKAGADDGATGENAIVYNVNNVDVIVGPLGIISANSMLGELTPRMAEAIAGSRVKKLLLPVHRCNIHIIGLQAETLPLLVDKLAVEIQLLLDDR